jgi:pimeloyl-ACP methyl ester carboxylesterase
MEKNSCDINGIPLAWYKTGTGKPLVILHGWGSNSSVMQIVADGVKDLRTSYLLDFPGFGNTPEPPKAWSVSDYATVTEAWLNDVLPEKPFDLLVHSFGGRVAIKLLSGHDIASRIQKVIFTGAAGMKPKRTASYYAKKYTAKSLKAPFKLLPGSLEEKGLNQLRKTSLWKMLGSSDYQQLFGVMRETFVKTVTEFLEDELEEIGHEILLIWGKNDTATPLYQGERMDNLLQSSALVTIEHAGHYAFLDQKVQFLAILKSYLKSEE